MPPRNLPFRNPWDWYLPRYFTYLGHGDLGPIEDAGLVHVVPGVAVQGGAAIILQPELSSVFRSGKGLGG